MKLFLYILCFFVLNSCSKSNDQDENCNFLLDVSVNATINLNLPQYSQLLFDLESVYVPNQGNAGIIVTNAVTGFLAWDASDPNHVPSSCSALRVSGANGTCGCVDGNTYNLITGQILDNSTLRCSLKNYRVEQNGNTLFISN